mgnify:CR=1 FL=1
MNERITPDDILTAVCVAYGIEREQLARFTHNARITCVFARARRAAFWWLTKGYGLAHADALPLCGFSGAQRGAQTVGLLADYESWLRIGRQSGAGDRYGTIVRHRRIADLVQARLDELEMRTVATVAQVRASAGGSGVWKVAAGEGPGY